MTSSTHATPAPNKAPKTQSSTHTLNNKADNSSAGNEIITDDQVEINVNNESKAEMQHKDDAQIASKKSEAIDERNPTPEQADNTSAKSTSSTDTVDDSDNINNSNVQLESNKNKEKFDRISQSGIDSIQENGENKNNEQPKSGAIEGEQAEIKEEK